MINLMNGDILKSDAEALVNTVNCMGIMGRGIALPFKKAYPDNFKTYEKVCKDKKLHPGMMLIFPTNTFENPRYIINFPTKRHWKGNSRLDDIQSGLPGWLRRLGGWVKSIAVPPLGCGLGGLDWKTVRPLIEQAFEDLPEVRVDLYEPKGAPEAQEIVNRTDPPKITIGRAAIIVLIGKYNEITLDEGVTLLEIQKLMYFMQAAGEPLRLRYAKGKYGPYADNLRQVLNILERHFIVGFGAGGEEPERKSPCYPELMRRLK